MHDEKLPVVKLWFKKADSDLKNIENNLKADEPPTDTICLHAQQAGIFLWNTKIANYRSLLK
jgi:hypothetical protein